MRQTCPAIVKWSFFTGTSTILLKLCYETFVKSALTTSHRSMSTYGQTLTSWASSGQRADATPNKFIDAQLRDDLKLIGAQVCFRHGARTPLNLLPGLEEVSYSKEHIESYAPAQWDIKLITKRGNQVVSRDQISSATDILGDRIRLLKSVSGDRVVTGQLTAVGEKQLFQLGQTIREELIKEDDSGLIPTVYDPKTVYCRSTFMDRTIASGRSFLAGLFSSAKTNSGVRAKGPFEIEVHHFPDEDMFPNRHVYPILKECVSALQLYSSLDDEHDLKKIRRALIDRVGVKDSQDGLVELFDDIASRRAHNFSIPDELAELAKDFDVSTAREFTSMATSIGFDNFIRVTCGQLLYLMKENFNSIAEKYLEETNNNVHKPYQKLFVYSGHDTTLIPLAMALEIFNMRWPTYAAHMLFKFFVSKSNPKEIFVAIDYANEPQLLPNCDSYYCPYSTFLKNLEDRFVPPTSVEKKDE